MADVFVLAGIDRLRDFRRIVEHGRVDEVASRKREFVEQVEKAPYTNAVSIVAPGERARIRRRSLHRHRMAKTGPERKVLDIDAEINREALALGPIVIRAPRDRGIIVALVVGQPHGCFRAVGPRPPYCSYRILRSAACLRVSKQAVSAALCCQQGGYPSGLHDSGAEPLEAG